VFQIVAELIEFLVVFAGEDDGTGAKAVTEGVHADGSLSFRSFGASGLARVTTIGVDLMDCCHIVFLNELNWRRAGKFRSISDEQSQFGGVFSFCYFHCIVARRRKRGIGGG
jgi:hypothetical protein